MWRRVSAVLMVAVTWWLLYVLGQRGEIAEEPATPEAYTGPTGVVQ